MTELQNLAKDNDHQNSSIKSYIVGFILSLVFTLIPYYIVVNHILSGSVLLVTILSFAVVQMLIQITFFLHLGRGPKPKWNLIFFAGTVGVIMFVVVGSIVIINNLHYNMQPSDQTKKLINGEGIHQIDGKLTGACYGQHTNHQVIIKNDKVEPIHTIANKCDTLTFINQDKINRDIAFGEHLYEIVYAGYTEIHLRKGRTETITLSQTGTHLFHDHLHDKITGILTVIP